MMKPKRSGLYNKFNKIKEYYEEVDKTRIKSRTFIRSTKHGVFGPSDCDVVFNLFKMLQLEKYKNFIDLGSGDGRVVLIASLFTKATGYETDKKLNKLAKKVRKDLDVKADFKTEDYFKETLSKYDVLFIYPSKSDDKKFKKKILNELKGLLITYKIYFPKYLKKVISFINDNYLKINCYRHPKERVLKG